MGKKRGNSPAAGRNQSQQAPQGRVAGARSFARGVRSELGRVSWPNRDQVRQSTMVVLIIVLVLAVYVAAWDFVFRNVARVVFL